MRGCGVDVDVDDEEDVEGGGCVYWDKGQALPPNDVDVVVL